MFSYGKKIGSKTVSLVHATFHKSHLTPGTDTCYHDENEECISGPASINFVCNANNCDNASV